jgi:hypothetical protein
MKTTPATKLKKKSVAPAKPVKSVNGSASVKRVVVTDPVPLSDAEKEIFNFVGDDPSVAPRPSQPIDLSDVKLSSLGSRDAIAAAKLKSTKSKAGTGPHGKAAKVDKDVPPVPPQLRDLLTRPDALKKLFLMINARLAEGDSVWSATDAEAADLADATVAVIDKYFPDLDKWSVELVFLFSVGLYAVPRVLLILEQRKAAAASVQAGVEASPSVSQPKPPPVVKHYQPRKTPIV